jgi:hypothetical protein
MEPKHITAMKQLQKGIKEHGVVSFREVNRAAGVDVLTKRTVRDESNPTASAAAKTLREGHSLIEIPVLWKWKQEPVKGSFIVRDDLAHILERLEVHRFYRSKPTLLTVLKRVGEQEWVDDHVLLRDKLLGLKTLKELGLLEQVRYENRPRDLSKHIKKYRISDPKLMRDAVRAVERASLLLLPLDHDTAKILVKDSLEKHGIVSFPDVNNFLGHNALTEPNVRMGANRVAKYVDGLLNRNHHIIKVGRTKYIVRGRLSPFLFLAAKGTKRGRTKTNPFVDALFKAHENKGSEEFGRRRRVFTFLNSSAKGVKLLEEHDLVRSLSYDRSGAPPGAKSYHIKFEIIDPVFFDRVLRAVKRVLGQ